MGSPATGGGRSCAADVPRSGFPWMTIREDAAMLAHVPRFLDPARPDIARPSCGRRRARSSTSIDPALAASLGDGVRVIKQNRGVFDAMPLSLITTQAIAELEALVGFGLDPQRFRPNLLVESDEREDAWVGSRAADRRDRDAGRPARRALRDRERRSCDRRARPGGPAHARPRAVDVHRRLRLDRAARGGRRRRPGPRRRLNAQFAHICCVAGANRCAHYTSLISQRLSWRRSAARGDTDVRSTASSSTRRPARIGSRTSSRATATC